MWKEHRPAQPPGVERLDDIILEAFARLDRTAFAVASGTVLGLIVLIATVSFASSERQLQVLPLELLAQYYPGYTVTYRGALLGFVYGFVSGGAIGWGIALCRNASLDLYLRFVRKRAELSRLADFLDRS